MESWWNLESIKYNPMTLYFPIKKPLEQEIKLTLSQSTLDKEFAYLMIPCEFNKTLRISVISGILIDEQYEDAGFFF